MLLVQEKRQQVLAERNQALPAQSGKGLAKIQIRMNVKIVDRIISGKKL